MNRSHFSFLTKSVITVAGLIGIVISLLGSLVGCAFSPSSRAPEIETSIITKLVTVEVTRLVEVTAVVTPYPTYTFAPTYTPLDHNVPTIQGGEFQTSTVSPIVTQSVQETPVSEVTPEPIRFSGEGDSVIDLGPLGAGVLNIIGNETSRYFSVEGYSETGESVDLFVSATEPYNGFRPFNWFDDRITVRLKVTAVGPWEILLYTLPYGVHIFNAPGTYNGNGDDVLLITGKPDVAKIIGNPNANYFSVMAHIAEGQELLVSDTEIYNGTVIIPSGTIFLEIQAVGPWTIELME